MKSIMFLNWVFVFHSQIVIECFVSLIVTCYGVINMAGKFKGIRAMADFQNK